MKSVVCFLYFVSAVVVTLIMSNKLHALYVISSKSLVYKTCLINWGPCTSYYTIVVVMFFICLFVLNCLFVILDINLPLFRSLWCSLSWCDDLGMINYKVVTEKSTCYSFQYWSFYNEIRSLFSLFCVAVVTLNMSIKFLHALYVISSKRSFTKLFAS